MRCIVLCCAVLCCLKILSCISLVSRQLNFHVIHYNARLPTDNGTEKKTTTENRTHNGIRELHIVQLTRVRNSAFSCLCVCALCIDICVYLCVFTIKHVTFQYQSFVYSAKCAALRSLTNTNIQKMFGHFFSLRYVIHAISNAQIVTFTRIYEVNWHDIESFT